MLTAYSQNDLNCSDRLKVRLLLVFLCGGNKTRTSGENTSDKNGIVLSWRQSSICASEGLGWNGGLGEGREQNNKRF